MAKNFTWKMYGDRGWLKNFQESPQRRLLVAMHKELYAQELSAYLNTKHLFLNTIN